MYETFIVTRNVKVEAGFHEEGEDYLVNRRYEAGTRLSLSRSVDDDCYFGTDGWCIEFPPGSLAKATGLFDMLEPSSN